MFYKGSGGLKSMFFEVISAAQKSKEKHLAFYDERNLLKKLLHILFDNNRFTINFWTHTLIKLLASNNTAKNGFKEM